MDHVSKAIQQAMQETSSRTTSTTQMNTNRLRDAEAALAKATNMAQLGLDEISKRWPGQTPWALDPEVIRAWGRAIIEQPFAITWPDLHRAIGRLTGRPYPPSVGALIAECKPAQIVSLEEARKALLQIDRANAKGKWWQLSPVVWQAIHELSGGSARVRNRADHGSEARAFLEAWRAAMAVAIKCPNQAIRAMQPLRPAAVLGPSDDERARCESAKERAVKEISQMLGISTPDAT